MKTAKQKIVQYLKDIGTPLAIHEFLIPGVSQNSIGTRLPELAKVGAVVGRPREGKNFKEWLIAQEGSIGPDEARA